MTARYSGHVVVDPAGPGCGCGAAGCVKVYASGAGIVDRAFESMLPPPQILQ